MARRVDPANRGAAARSSAATASATLRKAGAPLVGRKPPETTPKWPKKRPNCRRLPSLSERQREGRAGACRPHPARKAGGHRSSRHGCRRAARAAPRRHCWMDAGRADSTAFDLHPELARAALNAVDPELRGSRRRLRHGDPRSSRHTTRSTKLHGPPPPHRRDHHPPPPHQATKNTTRAGPLRRAGPGDGLQSEPTGPARP